MPKIMRMLNIISRCQSLYRNEKMPNSEIKACHHSFIFAICNHPGMSQDQISQSICLNKSTVARTLNNLEENGYIIRRVSESDKRATLVYPSEKMLEIFPRIKEISEEWNNKISLNISPGEMDIFMSVLSRISTQAKVIVGNGEGESKK